MKSKMKRVFVLEVDVDSPEYNVLYKLVNLSRENMVKIDFTEDDYKVSAKIQAEILKHKR